MKGDSKSSENAALGDALRDQRHDLRGGEGELQASGGVSDGLADLQRAELRVLSPTGAVGGAGENIERRYGTLTNGVFDPLANTGGSLRQLFGLGGFTVNNGQNCQSGTDANPAPGATIFAGRVTTPLSASAWSTRSPIRPSIPSPAAKRPASAAS